MSHVYSFRGPGEVWEKIKEKKKKSVDVFHGIYSGFEAMCQHYRINPTNFFTELELMLINAMELVKKDANREL